MSQDLISHYDQGAVNAHLFQHKILLSAPPVEEPFKKHNIKPEFPSLLMGYLKVVVSTLERRGFRKRNIRNLLGPPLMQLKLSWKWIPQSWSCC